MWRSGFRETSDADKAGPKKKRILLQYVICIIFGNKIISNNNVEIIRVDENKWKKEKKI